MSSFMENGSSDHNGEAEQVWERPWTLEEMQKNSTNWSLAADSGLFLFLQDFSQRMMSKTHEIEKQLDGLIRDTKATDSRLHTVFNDFLMLSNTQFIENRVYDEEVEEAASKSEASEKLPEQEKTREQKEAELIPKVQEAVNYGLMVLDLAFEQLDIKAGNSDSEDEEALEKVEPILEAKDLYVDRPLPFLIGSQAFMDQDDVGLGDLSSDEMSVDSDRDSVIESEDGESAEHSDDDDVNGSFKKKSSLASYEDIVDEDDDEDSDLFGGSDKEDDGLRNDAGQSSFADELAARIKAETPSKTEPDRTSLSSGLSVSQKKSKAKTEPKPQVEDDEDEMFKPPSMDYNEYSPFGGRGGLFSGGRGLFDDDNEGDLFSDAPKNEPLRKDKTTTKTAEPVKTKKMPSGAVSIFPESVENIERPGKPKLQAVSKQTSSSGGLFDDEDENDDDFFREKSNSKSTPVGNAKQTTKKAVDLFGGAKEDEEQDEDDGTMFSSKASAVQQDKSVEGEEETRPPEKKLPAGAISMFGPGTKSILVEGLKKRQHSASEESAISDESVPPSETVKAQPALAASGKTPSNSLFSDDEDSQIFLGDAKIKPKPLVQSKPNKASLSIFDDEEEEGLFSSMSKSGPVKKSSLPTSKSISSALFSDDEDQWKSKPESPEIKQTGIKPSFSAPSRLPTGKASQNNDLFNDDDDLFSTNDSSEKSSQRASLLFEDEDCDEDKDSFFNFTSSNKTSDVRATDAALFDPTKEANEPNVKKVDQKSVEKKPVGPVNSSEDSTEIKKKPIGGVSLFGGIDVFSNISNMKETSKKSEEEFFAYEEALTEAPPPIEVKSSKTKKTALSLFDDDDDDDDDDEYLEEIPAVPVAIPPVDKNTLKEYGPRVKSTGVFQDEELLFSQTQQRDNDPDVDLFTSSSKPMVPSPSSVKPAAATLFADDDEDDLFGPTKAPPKVAQKPSKPKADETDKPTTDTNKESTRPLKSKQTSSRIEKLQADLSVNPSTLLPGALPVTTSAVSGRRAVGEGGVSFESPALVSTLQNATKDRAKGAGRRRPQTRAARHLAAQQSEESVVEEQHEERSTHGHVAASLPNINPVSQQPTTLNVANTHAERSPDTVVRPKKFLDPGEDLFHSDDLFGSAPISKPVSSTAPKIKTTEEGHGKISSAEAVNAAKDQPSIFDSNEDTLFGSVKQMAPQKSKQMSFLDDEDDGDIFGGQKSKSTNSMSFKSEDNPVKHDIFQDIEAEPATFQKKNKDASLDASLFDNDDVDIFADLTGPTKPKEKKAKQKVETKSIFEEDMDDIFSTGNTRLTIKPKTTKKSTPDSGSTVDNIFDDPLNVFGGN